jgi:hypothetical protein
MGRSTLVEALKGGGIVAGALLVVIGIGFLVFSPAVLALGWVYGWWSFEVTVVALLVFIAYVGGISFGSE